MSMFLPVLLLLVAIPCGFVLLSYAFAWYEAANRNPGLISSRFSSTSLWFAVRLLATESVCLLATILLHPVGWFPVRDPEATENERVPVLFLHGLFHNRSCWLWMKYRLEKRHSPLLFTLNLPPWKDMKSLTDRVADRVEHILRTTGAKKLHLVGHSMGGIIARNFLQLQGGYANVDGCVLLAVPNRGSKLVPFGLSPLARQVMPESEFLRRLEHAPLPPATRFLAIGSRHDNIILPPENARWEAVPNLELFGSGHATLLFHPQAIEAIATHLEWRAV